MGGRSSGVATISFSYTGIWPYSPGFAFLDSSGVARGASYPLSSCHGVITSLPSAANRTHWPTYAHPPCRHTGCHAPEPPPMPRTARRSMAPGSSGLWAGVRPGCPRAGCHILRMTGRPASASICMHALCMYGHAWQLGFGGGWTWGARSQLGQHSLTTLLMTPPLLLTY